MDYHGTLLLKTMVQQPILGNATCMSEGSVFEGIKMGPSGAELEDALCLYEKDHLYVQDCLPT